MEFFGVFEHRIDRKGRISFPASWRIQVTNQELILTDNPVMDNFLLFPKECWKKMTRKEKEKFKIWIKLKIDPRGRIYLSPKIKQIFAHFNQGFEIVFQGRENIIVLWRKKDWKKYLNQKNCS